MCTSMLSLARSQICVSSRSGSYLALLPTASRYGNEYGADIMNEELKVRYQTQFNPKIFAAIYHGKYEFEQKWRSLDFLHDVFSKGKAEGKTMLDMGCGPTPLAAISAGKYIPEIYLCDLVQKNREQLNNWINRTIDAFDYSPQFEHVAQLEEVSDWKILEERTLKAVKEVIPGDVTQPNPITPMDMQFDIVSSFCCLECYPDIGDYTRYLHNLMTLIVPGGTYLSSGYIESTDYNLGDVNFPASSIDAIEARRLLAEAGLQIVEFHEYTNMNSEDFSWDYKALYSVIAKKPN